MSYSIQHLVVLVLLPRYFRNQRWDIDLAIGSKKKHIVSREEQCSIVIFETNDKKFFLQRRTSFITHHTCPLSFLLFDANDPEMNSIHLLSDYDEALSLANDICQLSMKKI